VKKKGEKRDRDDPNKRSEETTYSKLTPIGKFMRMKPTLLSTLQPSKHWNCADGWISFDNGPVVLDFDTSVRVPEDAFCSESVL